MTAADDPWGGSVPDAPTVNLGTFGAEPDPAALAAWDHQRQTVTDYVTGVDQRLLHALAAAEAQGEGQRVLDLIAWAQQTRRTLAAVEQAATRWAGLSGAVQETGTMPDGRTYKVRRGANRKAWDHDAWKHDARAAVLRRHGLEGVEVVNTATGELVDLQGVVTHVQEVHGSTAPRVGVLKSLDLDPDDYAETTPGAWSVEFVEPSSGEQ